mmetsp:Transcript_40582/g.66313  ORF Transcript_40582/g.66313 Transcript_40582/m.66313 type:complete len:95 (+) Transcript_40582:471-755(+)
MLTRENIVASSLMSHLATLPSDVALQALAEVKGYKGSANPGKLVVFTADQILHQRKEGSQQHKCCLCWMKRTASSREAPWPLMGRLPPNSSGRG